VSVAVHAADLQPEHMADHRDGVSSWLLMPWTEHGFVTIIGTPEEVSAFAMRLATCVSRHCVAQVEQVMHGEPAS
jgi:hypothetical protein